MIRAKFTEWVKCKNEELQSLFISTEYVKHKNPDEMLIPNPSIGIIHESEKCLGQVTVWESMQMEFEVVRIQSEELILWRYIEKLSDEPNFSEILKQYFQVLQTGLKP